MTIAPDLPDIEELDFPTPDTEEEPEPGEEIAPLGTEPEPGEEIAKVAMARRAEVQWPGIDTMSDSEILQTLWDIFRQINDEVQHRTQVWNRTQIVQMICECSPSRSMLLNSVVAQ